MLLWPRFRNCRTALYRGSLLFLLAAGLLRAFPLSADELYCLAASSLTDALTEAGKKFENQTKTKVLFNFAASSMLARQIEEGAPADLFFSADEQKMNQLQAKGLLLDFTRTSVLSNRLVIITRKDSKLQIKSAVDLTKSGRIAIAEYNSVPAGIYAREYLTKIGLWTTLKERLIPVQNARAALAAVESQNVDFAFVFKTDAQISQQVRVAYEVPANEGQHISYSLAVLKDSPNVAAAMKFHDFLQSTACLDLFRRYGFLVLPKRNPK